MHQLIWTCMALWLGACDVPPDVKSQIACTTICTCFFGPVGVDRCVEECIDEGDLATVPEDCFECIQSHANQCATLERDCESLCEAPQPPNDLPDGGMQ